MEVRASAVLTCRQAASAVWRKARQRRVSGGASSQTQNSRNSSASNSITDTPSLTVCSAVSPQVGQVITRDSLMRVLYVIRLLRQNDLHAAFAGPPVLL